jgi:hypothetical protein
LAHPNCSLDRENLKLYGCDVHLKNIFPSIAEERSKLFDLHSSIKSLPPKYAMYGDPAEKLATIPEPCQLYISMGCAFVLKLQELKQSRQGWTKFVNVTAEKIISEYVSPIDKSVGLIAHYTGADFLKSAQSICHYFTTSMILTSLWQSQGFCLAGSLGTQ